MATVDGRELQLSTLTAEALKDKLTGMVLLAPENPGQRIYVDATYSRPEKWILERKPPAVNINLLSTRFDPTRQTTAILQRYETDAKDMMLQKHYYMPVSYFFEIRFIVAYGQHSMSLSEQILRRLPPLGFGGFLEFLYDGVRFECPFELVDDKDVFARYGETEDNREFERVFRYKVQGWLDSNPVLADPRVIDASQPHDPNSGYSRVPTILTTDLTVNNEEGNNNDN